MKLLMIVAAMVGMATISSADQNVLTVEDPVIVQLAGYDLQRAGEIEESEYTILVEHLFSEGLKRINESEFHLYNAFFYAQQICYGRRVDGEFSIEDGMSEPKPEMIEMASAGLNGLIFHFECSSQ